MGGEALIVIGQITRPHGLYGEVKVRPMTDFPDRFNGSRRFFIRTRTNRGEWKVLRRQRWQKSFVLMQFEGIETREAAENLRSATIEIPHEWRHDLPAGEFYISDLIGCRVKTDAGESLGILDDILKLSAQDLYVIKDGDREILIPGIREFIRKIDLKAGEILIDPIEGLLD